ncbi:MAG: AMP-binding protein, partial [Martelella sp.]
MSEEGNLIAAILAHAETRPGDTALICNGESASWLQLRDDVLATAGALSARCDGNVGRIALMGTADIGLVTAYLAIIAAGGCAVPLPASAHPDALAGMLADCDPGLVFVQAGYDLPTAYAGRVVKLDADAAGGVPAAFRNEAAPLAAPVTADPDAPFNIIYSSGTTGRAKGIVHPHRMRYRQAARTLFGLDAGSTMLLATPLYSNTTLMPMLSALFHGARVALMQKFDAERYLDLAESLRATHTMLVPVQYQRILAADSFKHRDLSAFKVKQSTGAPLPVAAKRALVDTWAGDFFEVY